MGNFSDYLACKIVEENFGHVAFASSSTYYFGLATTDITSTNLGTDITEPSTANAYARVAYSNVASNWTTAESSGGVIVTYNTAAVTFSTCDTTGWGSVTYAFIADAATGGNLLVWGALTTPKTISTGDTASFAANAFKITLD
jgi:hypothetical protein